MTAIFTLFLIINLFVLSSLLLAKRILSIYEITVNLFFVAAITHLMFSAVSLNAKRIVFIETKMVFWILEMDRLIFIPCFYIWILVSWVHNGCHAIQKIVMTIWWIVFMIGMEQVYHSLGLTQFHKWHAGYSLIEYTVLLALSIPFSVWFRKLLWKEGKIKCG